MIDRRPGDLDDIAEPILRWVAKNLAAGARVVGATRLRTHGGPWLLRVEEAGVREAVLKHGRSFEWGELYACEAAGLRLAAEHGISAPRLLAFTPGVNGSDSVALLLSRLPGTTQIPRVASADRLRALGRIAATIHSVPLLPSEELPLRTRHTAWTDFALWRQWGNRYRAAASDAEQESVLREFVAEHPLGGAGAMTGAVAWSTEGARETLSTTSSTPLLDEAAERLRVLPVPDGPTVFVHGDLWQGNTLWEGDRCVGVIDWEVAGAGQPGVDLGCLRWDAAMLFDGSAADEVLTGWEATGRRAADVAYWDLVAVLNYPTNMSLLVSTLTEQGRPDLDERTLTDRRDAWVEAALAQLE